MSDLETLFSLLCNCSVDTRAYIANQVGVPLCLIQDFVHGHCGLDEELTLRITSAATFQAAE